MIYVRQPFCYRCGRPLAAEDEEYCVSCSREDNRGTFTQGRSLCLYEGAVREAVHAVKYHNKREYLDIFAQEMAARFAPLICRWQPQAIVPVPMHPSAKRRRGFNQAETLARRLGALLDLPVDVRSLRKIRRTKPQKELDYRQRKRNLCGAFSVRETVAWKRVLLIDDVCTTGSTLKETARMLRKAGVEEVYFLTVCTVSENR